LTQHPSQIFLDLMHLQFGFFCITLHATTENYINTNFVACCSSF